MVTEKYLKHEDRINPKYESLFAIGVDEMSWDDILEENYEWPIFVKDFDNDPQKYRIQSKHIMCKCYPSRLL